MIVVVAAAAAVVYVVVIVYEVYVVYIVRVCPEGTRQRVGKEKGDRRVDIKTFTRLSTCTGRMTRLHLR